MIPLILWFFLTDGKKISRKCSASTEKCISPSCYYCNTDACNIHIACKKCDSSSDPHCSTSTFKVKSELCDADIKCITQVNQNKHTERKCAPSKDFKCPENKTMPCQECKETDCNSEVFPKDRRTCYQCENCNDIEGRTELACTLYDPEDKCYSFGTSKENLTRGCISDSIKACTDESTKDKCLKCNENGCNTVSFMIEPKLKCIQCDASDEKCISGYKSEDADVCQREFEYWKQEQEQCFVEILTDGKTTRGCVFDRDESAKECTDANNCSTCSKDGCNTDPVPGKINQ